MEVDGKAQGLEHEGGVKGLTASSPGREAVRTTRQDFSHRRTGHDDFGA